MQGDSVHRLVKRRQGVCRERRSSPYTSIGQEREETWFLHAPTAVSLSCEAPGAFARSQRDEAAFSWEDAAFPKFPVSSRFLNSR